MSYSNQKNNTTTYTDVATFISKIEIERNFVFGVNNYIQNNTKYITSTIDLCKKKID